MHMAQERALVVSAQGLDKLRRALASVGFLNAASAASGGEARRAAAQDTWPLVVINAPLPDETGLELAMELTGTTLSAVVLLVRKSPWNLLKILAAILCGMGVFVVALEWLINRSFYPARAISWSVYTCIPCLLLGAALFVIDRNPACKQELKKRFFF